MLKKVLLHTHGHEAGESFHLLQQNCMNNSLNSSTSLHTQHCHPFPNSYSHFSEEELNGLVDAC